MKKNRSLRYFVLGGVYLSLFLALTLWLVLSDFGEYTGSLMTSYLPRPGAEGYLCELNEELYIFFGSNPFWYDLSEILGLASFLVPLSFGGMGLFQLCKRKSLKKVDKDLYFLAGLYAVTGICYLLFEKVVVNYRPVLMEGALEASYPSSHTVLVCVIMASGAFCLARRLGKRWMRIVVMAGSLAVMAAVSFGRLLAGVHWFTDVFAGVLLAGGLVFLFKGLVLRFCDRSRR